MAATYNDKPSFCYQLSYRDGVSRHLCGILFENEFLDSKSRNAVIKRFNNKNQVDF
jgi:hypothetical protein